MMDPIVSWIFATALGLLWSGPPRRPRTPWMITALLLFGLLCWIVGGRP